MYTDHHDSRRRGDCLAVGRQHAQRRHHPDFPAQPDGVGGGRTRGSRPRGAGRGRAQRGDVRTALLLLLAEQPMHGYQIMRELGERSGGVWRPSPGSIYPSLTLLEELGHVRAASSEGAKRLFEITDEGREFIAQNKANIDGITARMGLAARSMSGQMPPEAVHQAMHTLKAALMLHRGTWSDSESDRVRDIIERAAEAISKEPGRE